MVIFNEVKQVLHALIIFNLENSQLRLAFKVLREQSKHISILREDYLRLSDIMEDNLDLLLKLASLSFQASKQYLVMKLLAHLRLLHFHHIDRAIQKVVHNVLLLARVWVLFRENILHNLNGVLLKLLVDL